MILSAPSARSYRLYPLTKSLLDELLSQSGTQIYVYELSGKDARDKQASLHLSINIRAPYTLIP